MKMRPTAFILAVSSVWLLTPAGRGAEAPRRNVLIFVADGLRRGSVNPDDTPALWAVRNGGVDFADSHSVFPTFTTANASAIATGHGLGDTGDYSNTIWTGFPTFDTGNFALLPGTPVPFIEDDRVLADLDSHFGGNYLGAESLLAIARAHGYHTAAIGKAGPTAIQDVTAAAPEHDGFPAAPPGVIVDDNTGGGAGVPLAPAIAQAMIAAGVPAIAPTRTNGFPAGSRYDNGAAGDRSKPGTLAANTVQQGWFADVATRVVLPAFAADPGTPFAIVFWSRDPDGSQHNQGDSHGTLYPGINGDTSRLGVRNADRMLQTLLAWFDAHPAIKANTDIFVTSDHGFATVSRTEIDRAGHPTASESAKHDYVDGRGQIDTLQRTLPNGFLALDLAYDLQLNVFDPDQHPAGSRLYKKLAVGSSADRVGLTTWEHPLHGNALVGGSIRRPDGADARFIVAANGGSDLIYVPDGSRDTVQQIVGRLLTYDYVSGIFVDDRFGPPAGTLPLSAINLVGRSRLPRPALVVAFKFFYLNPSDLQSAVQISDTSQQEGQGMHGGFGRDSTFNNMAAIGPDFKQGFVDAAPVGNADITPTLAHVLGFALADGGPLAGRVADEALAGRPAAAGPAPQVQRSDEAHGKRTTLVYQEHGGIRYLDTGCFADTAAGAAGPCR